MTVYIALDKATGDVMKPIGGGIQRVKDGRFIVQQVQCKLRTFLGEWILDSRIGFLNFDNFEKNFSTYDIEDKARELILGTKGVLSISSLVSTYKDRKLNISFQATTVYGTIDSEVPWDNINDRENYN